MPPTAKLGQRETPGFLSRKTRLEVVIERMLAQRNLIDYVMELVSQIPGPILELGLGSGRTYDHLRSRFSEREIFVFDRDIAMHPSCRPDAEHFLQGDFRETLPRLLAGTATKAAVAHCDIGSYDREASRELATAITPLLMPIMAPRAVVLSDQPMTHSVLRPEPLPDNVMPGSYFMYRVTPAALER